MISLLRTTVSSSDPAGRLLMKPLLNGASELQDCLKGGLEILLKIQKSCLN